MTYLLPAISAHFVHMAGTSDGVAHFDAVAQSFYYAARDPHSGAFLTAKPCGTTELEDAEFHVPLRIRLRAEQLPSGHRCATHECKIDPEAPHALSCKNWQGAVHRRHDIRDVIYKFCSVLDHTAEIKRDLPLSDSEGGSMVVLEQHAGGPKIFVDIMVRLSCGRSTKTFYDVNVINFHTDAAIGKSLGTAGLGTRIDSVLFGAYDRKSRKHAADVARVGCRFLPLIVTHYQWCLEWRLAARAPCPIRLHRCSHRPTQLWSLEFVYR